MDQTNQGNRYFYLVIGAISMLFAGIIYAWSILKAPLAEEFGFANSALALNFTLTMCAWCIGGLIGSALTKKISRKWTMLLAGALVIVGFWMCSALSGSIVMLYFAYGILASLGIGIAYNIVISSTNAWFPDKKGMCSGVLMMAFGVSALVLGNIANSMIGNAAIGWRKTYLVLGVIIGAVLIVTGFLVRIPGPGVDLPKPQPKAGAPTAGQDFTTSEMMHRSSFWRFFIYCILNAGVGNVVISFARDLTLSVGATAALAATLVGVLSVCNGLGRVICGFVFDATGRRTTMLIAAGVTILAPLLVLISLFSGSLGLCIVGLCLTGISYGFSPTVVSAFIGEFYGMKNFQGNYGMANMFLIPMSFEATIASALQVSTGSFVAPFIMLLAFAVVAFIIQLSIKRP